MMTALAEINRKATEIAARIKLLSSVSWRRDAATEERLLTSLERGDALPTLIYNMPDHTEELEQLVRLRDSFQTQEPLEMVTRANIASYMDGAHLVQAMGTPRFTELSCDVFGRPTDPLPGTSMTNLMASERLLALGKDFEHPYVESLPVDVDATTIAQELQALLDQHATRRPTQAHRATQNGNGGPGTPLPIKILVVDGLAAKATATSETIRLRSGRWFHRYDARQLFAHEIMTHALTARSGLNQPILKTMGRGAPRTTATQEGLATFSEWVSGALDLKRLMRLALRTLAIERALNGADFRETFRFFLDHGQGSHESLYSTLRIFRGTQPQAPQSVFTKDVVYLAGLLRLHALFRWALAHRRIGLVHLLFCGRLAIEDCFVLEGALDEGSIAPPVDLPEWYENIEGLAGQLTFSMISGALGSDASTLSSSVEF
jgi:uncharacterized protein (TIGR02421 family)